MFGLVPILLTWALPLLAAVHGPGFESHPPSQWFSTCQRRTANPLDGCLPHTIYVSQTDNRAHFKTVQSAIASIPHDKSPSYILIAPGNYTEQLNITRPGPLYLLGMSDYPHESTPYADIDYNTTKSNDVQIWWYVS
jgi:pectin methylesterase-like acyl-CoA thioesterase